MANRWSVLTVLVLLFCAGTLVNTIYDGASIPSLIGIVLVGLMSYWVLVGVQGGGSRWRNGYCVAHTDV